MAASVDRNQALLKSERLVRATETSALALQYDLLSTSIGSHTASISQALSSIDGIEAEYTLRIDNNGVITGMVLRSELDESGVPASEVAFVADKFAIISPGETQRTAPFVVYTTPQEIGGVVVPAGVYLKDAAIRNGMINRAKISDSLESDNYAESGGLPTAGLKLDFATGTAKFSGPVISRNIVAAEGDFAFGPFSVPVGSGIRVVKTWDLIETGVSEPLKSAWMPSTKAYFAAAAFVGGVGSNITPPGTPGSGPFWGCTADVTPFASWTGPQQLRLRIRLWTDDASDFYGSGGAGTAGRIYWKLYEVT